MPSNYQRKMLTPTEKEALDRQRMAEYEKEGPFHLEYMCNGCGRNYLDPFDRCDTCFHTSWTVCKIPENE